MASSMAGDPEDALEAAEKANIARSASALAVLNWLLIMDARGAWCLFVREASAYLERKRNRTVC